MFGYEEPEGGTEAAPRERKSLKQPVIGMCICICLWVLSILVGFEALCGPGHGFESMAPASQPQMGIAVVLFFGTILGFIGCVVWLIVRAIRNEPARRIDDR
ncbi:MAG: hypothetical protein V4555_11605 [Acidobacteriota bacterium]